MKQIRALAVAVSVAMTVGTVGSTLAPAVFAEENVVPRPVPWPSARQPAYPTSPFHGVIDGNGRVIACRCRFAGRDYRLGDLVCLNMPSGKVLARCDLEQNNTSWVATDTPCTISHSVMPGESRRQSMVMTGISPRL